MLHWLQRLNKTELSTDERETVGAALQKNVSTQIFTDVLQDMLYKLNGAMNMTESKCATAQLSVKYFEMATLVEQFIEEER